MRNKYYSVNRYVEYVEIYLQYAFPGTVLPGQYSSAKSSTIVLLFVLTSVETRFLYRSKAVLLQSYKTFSEVGTYGPKGGSQSHLEGVDRSIPPQTMSTIFCFF